MTAICRRCGTTWPVDPSRAVACPHCFARPGSPCVRPSGHGALESHVEREAAALAAGKLGRCPAAPPVQTSFLGN